MDVEARRVIWTDGYSSDYVHRFDARGKYLGTFVRQGRQRVQHPAEDRDGHALRSRADHRDGPLEQPRRAPRVDGEFLGVVNGELLLPAQLRSDGDVVVGELNGRVTILDKAGKAITHLGTNTEDGIGTNRMPPERWRTGYVVAAHGVATNAEGDVFVAEFSTFGRVHKFDRR